MLKAIRLTLARCLALHTIDTTRAARLPPPPQRLRNFPVGFVLAERIHRPDRRGQPADDGDLQNQAYDASERAPDGEKLQPRQENSQQQAHTPPSKLRLKQLHSPQAVLHRFITD